MKEFQEQFAIEHEIELEIKNTYDKLLLSAGKKHYVGFEKGKIETVGFEAEKSDRPEFFSQVYSQLIEDIIKHNSDPIPNVKKAFSDLGSNKISPDLLKISKCVNKEIEEYEPTTQVYSIAKALNAKQGDIIEYYNCDKKKTGKSWTLEPEEIDIEHYKNLLWNIVDEILQIAGYPVAELSKELGIKSKAKKKRISRNDIGSIEENTSIGGGM